MRKLFALLLAFGPLVSCHPSYAGQGVHINTASNGLSTAYTTAFPGLAMTVVNPTTKHLVVQNACSNPIAISFTNYTAAVAPSSSTTTNPQQYFVNPSSTAPFPSMGCGKYVWLRSDGASSCSTGDIVINCY